MSTVDFVPLNQTHSQVNTLELDPLINSDHASVGVKIGSLRIMASNISNPEFHKYFSSGPFKTTHLNTSKTDPDPTKRAWLHAKIQLQINQIVEGFVDDKWDCYVIIEAFNYFVDQLKTKLFKTGFGSSYGIIGTYDHTNHTDCKNKTIILVNLKRQHSLIRSNEILQKTHISYNDKTTSRTLEIPVVRMKDLFNGKLVTVFGVHLSGCDNQFPANAITILKDSIRESPDENIIGIGDFNTVPNNINTIVDKSNIKVITPLYLTHINQRYEAVAYDNIIYSGNIKPEQLSLDEMDISSQLFVKKLTELATSNQN
jgi:hypothetical protein